MKPGGGWVGSLDLCLTAYSSIHLPTWILSRPDRVGDVIIATACLEAVRRQRPGVRLVFAAREVMRPLLEGHPLLDGFIGLTAQTGWRQLSRTFGAHHADAIAHLHADHALELGSWAAKIPLRVGRRHSIVDRLTLTHRLPETRREGRKHEAQYNFDVLAPLGIVAPGLDALRPRVHLPPRWRDSLAAKAGAGGVAGGCVLNPTAFSPVLRWPAEAFARFAEAAAGRLGRIILVAERADDPSVNAIRERLRAGSVAWSDLSGQLNLAELGWLLRDARVLISRNTGTAHLAAAVGCPVVELFGRREPIYGPGRWRALGERTAAIAGNAGPRRRGESKRAYWRRGYEVITVGEVLEAALSLTGAGSEMQTQPSS